MKQTSLDEYASKRNSSVNGRPKDSLHWDDMCNVFCDMGDVLAFASRNRIRLGCLRRKRHCRRSTLWFGRAAVGGPSCHRPIRPRWTTSAGH